MPRKRLAIETILVMLGIVVRASAVIVLQSHTVPRSTYEHGEIAANLLAGRGFSMHFLGSDGPTSQQAPVYPALVALAFAVGGVDSPGSLLILELGQSVLGGLLVLGVLKLCRGIAPNNPQLGWLAAAVAAVHPTLVYAATHVQVALLAATLLVWVLAWAYRTGASGSSIDAGVTGGLLGLLALTDPILSLGAIGVLSAIWIGPTGAKQQKPIVCRLSAEIGLLALLVIAPWLVRNALVHKEFVAIKSTFGYAFWQGNCALSEGTDKVVRPSAEKALARGGSAATLSVLNRAIWDARHEAGYLDDIALTQEERNWLGHFREPRRSRILFRRALDDLKAEPGRYAWLCLRRLQYFLLFDETNPKTRVLAYRMPHIALTILAAAGLVLAGEHLRRRLLPTVLTVLAIMAFHTLTIVSARFHVPIEPLMAVWSGAGVCRILRISGRSVLPSARDDIESVRVVDGLGVLAPIRRQFLDRANVHSRNDQGDEHGRDADNRGRAPGDAGDFTVQRHGLVGDRR
jgi:hypothetical protein